MACAPALTGKPATSASAASAAHSHFYPLVRGGQGISERQSRWPGSFPSSSPLKNFKGCTVFVCVPCSATRQGCHTPGASFSHHWACAVPREAWAPGLAHPVFPSTHRLFSTPARGRLGPREQDSASAGLTPSRGPLRSAPGPWFLDSWARRVTQSDRGGERTEHTRVRQSLWDLPGALLMTPGGSWNFSELQGPRLPSESNKRSPPGAAVR